MNEKLNVKIINNFVMPLFFHILTKNHFERDFLNKLYVWSTFRNISLRSWNPIDKKFSVNTFAEPGIY